jgi:hypothetical protein
LESAKEIKSKMNLTYRRLATDEDSDGNDGDTNNDSRRPILAGARGGTGSGSNLSAMFVGGNRGAIEAYGSDLNGGTVLERVCFVFCLTGALFLSIVAYNLAIASPYLKLGKVDGDRRQRMVWATIGAVSMYLLGAALSAYSWHKKARGSSGGAKYRRFADY